MAPYFPEHIFFVHPSGFEMPYEFKKSGYLCVTQHNDCVPYVFCKALVENSSVRLSKSVVKQVLGSRWVEKYSGSRLQNLTFEPYQREMLLWVIFHLLGKQNELNSEEHYEEMCWKYAEKANRLIISGNLPALTFYQYPKSNLFRLTFDAAIFSFSFAPPSPQEEKFRRFLKKYYFGAKARTGKEIQWKNYSHIPLWVLNITGTEKEVLLLINQVEKSRKVVKNVLLFDSMEGLDSWMVMAL